METKQIYSKAAELDLGLYKEVKLLFCQTDVALIKLIFSCSYEMMFSFSKRSWEIGLYTSCMVEFSQKSSL